MIDPTVVGLESDDDGNVLLPLPPGAFEGVQEVRVCVEDDGSVRVMPMPPERSSGSPWVQALAALRVVERRLRLAGAVAVTIEWHQGDEADVEGGGLVSTRYAWTSEGVLETVSQRVAIDLAEDEVERFTRVAGAPPGEPAFDDFFTRAVRQGAEEEGR